MTDALSKRKTVMPGRAPEAALARRPDSIRELLAFVVADESYALPLSRVREILKPPPITEVPRAPADVLGIVTVRGRIVTVLDLRRRLRMPEGPHTRHTRVLLVDDGKEVIGLLVDRVLQVHRLEEEELELAATVAGDTADYVMGIGRPRAPGRAAARARTLLEAKTVSDQDILILLDPGPLLKR